MQNRKKDNIYSKVTIPVPVLDLMILSGIALMIILVAAAMQ